ncbi:hypothetical protein [Pendulispora albinea]|uniref:Uncharacterized protein n=1 Tax=Pendulispora albinea TaxID=2741071 RepID=A0ABZ2LZ74_9BACT
MTMQYAPQVKWFLLPLPLLALFLGAEWLAGPATGDVVRGGVLLGKFFTLIGFALAATRFSWGDRMHRIWSLFVLNMVGLLGQEFYFGYVSVRWPELALSPEAARPVLGVVLLIANIASTMATVLLARTWREAGLEVESTKLRHMAKLAVVPIAFAIFVVSMRENLQREPADVWDTIVLVILPFGDFVCFSLIGPLALTAFSLRGGSLALPWAMFALGSAFWVAWDVATTMSHLSGVAIEAMRILALGYTGCAGIEQWWVLRPQARFAV